MLLFASRFLPTVLLLPFKDRRWLLFRCWKAIPCYFWVVCFWKSFEVGCCALLGCSAIKCRSRGHKAWAGSWQSCECQTQRQVIWRSCALHLDRRRKIQRDPITHSGSTAGYSRDLCCNQVQSQVEKGKEEAP